MRWFAEAVLEDAGPGGKDELVDVKECNVVLGAGRHVLDRNVAVVREAELEAEERSEAAALVEAVEGERAGADGAVFSYTILKVITPPETETMAFVKAMSFAPAT